MIISPRNESTPASIGLDCLLRQGSGESAHVARYQFVVLRVVDSVRFAFVKSDGNWSSLLTIASPERFGPVPTTYDELLAWVTQFDSGVELEWAL